MPDPEHDRLYGVAMDAFREAKKAFGEGPWPMSPKMIRWQELLKSATAANTAYTQYVERRSPKRPFDRSPSN